jgi:hypothetical protein
MELPVVSIEEVRALVSERQRYDEWLSALEARRAETPEHVFERVRRDYAGRRADVMARLQGYVGALTALGSDLSQRLDDVDQRLGALADEQAEAMLRTAVGEYDHGRWEAVRLEVEARLASLGEERATLITEFEDVRTLLSSAHVEPPKGGGVGDAAPQADQPAPVQEVGQVATPAWRDATRHEPDPAASHQDVVVTASPADHAPAREVPPHIESDGWEGPQRPLERQLLPEEFVISTPTPAGGEPALADNMLLDIDVQGVVDGPVPSPAPHEEVLADVAALFDTSSLAALPDEESPAAESRRAPETPEEFDQALSVFGNADAEFVRSLEGIERQEEVAPAAPATEPFDDLAFLRSVTEPSGSTPAEAAAGDQPPAAGRSSQEPQKTLRCTECGTMNLPTEWYCERCGGELAAF